MSREDVGVPGHFGDLVLDLFSACLSGRDKTGLNRSGLWLKTPRDTQSAFFLLPVEMAVTQASLVLSHHHIVWP